MVADTNSNAPVAQLHIGDCVQVMRRLREESVDLVLADPPYFLSNGGVTVRSGRRQPVDKGTWDSSGGLEADDAFTVEWMTEALRVLAPDGSMWVSGTMHSIHSIGFAARQLGMRIVNDVIWFKPNAPFNAGCRSFTHRHQTLLWLTKGDDSRHTFDYRWTKTGPFEGDKLKSDGKQIRSVWSLPVAPRRERVFGDHPTQKPESLVERIIRATSRPGDLVLDPFAGSGTTGAVAVRFGRRYVGIEMDRNYALGIAAPRISANLPGRELVQIIADL